MKESSLGYFFYANFYFLLGHEFTNLSKLIGL